MKTENKVLISDIRTRLHKRMKFDNPKEAFEKAWYMWKQYCLRHHIHKSQFFSQTLKKGWIRREHADHFWWCMTDENHF